MLKQKISSLL